MTEKRRYDRVPFHCRTTIAARPDGVPFEAWTVDLSLGGVRLASDRPYPTGQVISITFRVRDGSRGEAAEAIEGTIVHTQPESEGYLLCIEFVGPLDASRHARLIRKLERC